MWDGHGYFCSGDGASEPQDDSEGVERNKGEPGTNAIALLNPFLVLGFRGTWGAEFGSWRWSLGRGGGVWGRGRRSLGVWEAEFGS